MATPRLAAEFARLYPHKVVHLDTARQLSKGFAISSTAEYQDRFYREQSLQTRRAEWEKRAEPIRGYGIEIARLLLIGAAIYSLFIFVSAVVGR